ncbi:phage tail protein [Mixta intestinalis]|uniref:Phage tail protein n=1 Tax=Mixta intestinalis TaxID=1615494 RepID=A0A6P1Q0K5_9GAMM|nr:phage tail protein [Mixta intestinalis]QHM72470.1 hypothetical protein C7M51_02783 [Mixta intestinalis]
MLMIYGMLPFIQQTLPYSTMTRSNAYRWVDNVRVGERAASQFLGPGDETIKISGELRPPLIGGTASLTTLKLMADNGRAWPLISGNGLIYGMYVIQSINSTYSELYSDGSARKISFDMTLKRVDESLIALFGDLKDQAVENLYKVRDKALDAVNSVASSINGTGS